MNCIAGLSLKQIDSSIRFRSIFFLGWALGWLVLSFSAREYADKSLFALVLSGRIFLIFLSLFFCVVPFFKKFQSFQFKNMEMKFLFVCLFFQAVCTVLEGLQSTDLTRLMAVFVLMIPFFHTTTEKDWTHKIFPLLLSVTGVAAVPLFFKWSEPFESVAALTESFSAVIAATVVSFFIGRATAGKNEARTQASELQRQLKKEKDCQKDSIEHGAQEFATAKIAQATRMMAHDIRRPFSMLRTGISLLRSAKTPDQILARAESLIPDVEDSLRSVDSLISDILAMNAQEPLKKVPLKVEDLLHEATQDFIRQNPKSKISFNFTLLHTKQIYADEKKIRRVIFHILAHANEAIGGAGSVTIATSKQLLAGIEAVEIFIISDPRVSSKVISSNFDLLDTAEREDREDGLGLATAKTFVTQHEGEFVCEFNSEGGVCVSFVVHSAGSSNILEIPALTKQSTVQSTVKKREHSSIQIPELENNSGLPKNFHILIVEDELLFQEGLVNEIENCSLDGYEFTTATAADAAAACQCMSENAPDLIFLDIDLGPMSPDGFEFLKKIRSQGSNTFVCIHSNRAFFGPNATPQELGADCAVPKPMNIGDLSRILKMAIAKQFPSKKPKIVVVDDEDCYLTAWKETMLDAEVVTFDDPETFWDEVIEKASNLNVYACMIFDFYFKRADMDRLKLVRTLRSKGYTGPIVLSTNAPYDNSRNSARDRFDFVTDKEAMTFAELAKIPEIKARLQRKQPEV